MYINNDHYGYYTSDGQQRISMGDFLLLIEPENAPIFSKGNNLRAIVRKVALQQLGHWMMGTARVMGHSITVSGSYGSDGLPMRVPQKVYDIGVPLPDELYEAWSHGGGWNSAGSEAKQMARWANENIGLLVSKSDPRSTQ